MRGRVVLVAGATRGAGRAIAVSLGLAGAKVYATGRSVRGRPATPGRSETIEETAEMIRGYGGTAVAVRVDHTVPDEVRRLSARLRRAEGGRLDVLVNDIWGGEELTEWGLPPWRMSWDRGRTMIERAVFSHIITSRYLVPLMVARRRGLVVEVTDGAHSGYRGSFYYDLVKTTVIRLATAYAAEFDEARLSRISAVAVTPGFLRSEFMLDQFGVREENWRDAIGKARHFEASETPYLLGRGVVALAADPQVHKKSGRVLGSWTLAREYGFTDRDGTRPNWGAVFARIAQGPD
ncbi:MAG TPA: SDR family oxidoreductase [Thermoplasmata archaeon]|nr:SDR family oxidoreductase [Thermoplasmata archaeon]